EPGSRWAPGARLGSPVELISSLTAEATALAVRKPLSAGEAHDGGAGRPSTAPLDLSPRRNQADLARGGGNGAGDDGGGGGLGGGGDMGGGICDSGGDGGVGVGGWTDRAVGADWYAPASTKRRLRRPSGDDDVSTSATVSGSHTRADTPLDGA